VIRVSVEWLSGDGEAGLRRLYAVCMLMSCRGYPEHPVLISLCHVGECNESEQLSMAPILMPTRGEMLGLSKCRDTSCHGLQYVWWFMVAVLRFIFPFFERRD